MEPIKHDLGKLRIPARGCSLTAQWQRNWQLRRRDRSWGCSLNRPALELHSAVARLNEPAPG